MSTNEKLLQVNDKIFTFLCISSGRKNIVTKLIFTALSLFCIYNIFPTSFLIYSYSTLHDFNLIPLSFEICLFTCSFNVNFVMITSCLNGNKIKRALKNLGDFKGAEKPDGVKRLNATLNVVTIIIFIISFTVYVIFLLLYSTSECFGDGSFACRLFTNMESVDKTQLQVFLYISSLSFVAYVGSMLLFFYSSCWVFVEQRILHLQNMLWKFRAIDRPFRREHIKKCVRFHTGIVKVANALSEVTRTPSIITMLSWQIILLILGIRFSVESDYAALIINIGYFVYMLVQTTVAESIYIESLKLETIAMHVIPWDDDKESYKSLSIIMEFAARPIAAPIGRLTVWRRDLIPYMIRIPFTILVLRLALRK